MRTPAVFHSSDVIYYEADDLLPLDTGGTKDSPTQKGDPVCASQPIISVPPEADNKRQTIVTPPKLKLSSDVPLPNVVAWSQAQPTIPVAAIANSRSAKLPVMTSPVIAPAPQVSRNVLDPAPMLAESVVAPAPGIDAVSSRNPIYVPQPAVVEPPPSVDPPSTRRLSDISIGHTQVIAPAPQLPVGEQRALPNGPAGAQNAVVPPPPAVQGMSPGNSGGRLVALNLHPMVPNGPVDVPAGNRRGTFAATPEGKSGAAGTPEIASANGAAAASATAGAGKNTNGLPPGLLVGAGPKAENSSVSASHNTASAKDPPLVASLISPRVTVAPPAAYALPVNPTSELEREIFGGRQSYGMTLNTPNLNSAGGSWVIHFAELQDNFDPQHPANQALEKVALIAPVATEEVDPGYPIELMRENVQGTVTLSAVIHIDGSVGEVKVVSGIDDRLDQYACAALARWRFRPATKNGNPVALRAVVRIPFKPTAKKSAF